MSIENLVASLKQGSLTQPNKTTVKDVLSYVNRSRLKNKPPQVDLVEVEPAGYALNWVVVVVHESSRVLQWSVLCSLNDDAPYLEEKKIAAKKVFESRLVPLPVQEQQNETTVGVLA